MSLESWLAFRYLFSRGKETLIWIITTVAVLGVAIGVGALIVVISVMEGFDREMIDRILGVQSHAILYNWPDGDFLDYGPLVERLESIPEIEGASPTIAEQVLLQASAGSGAYKLGAELRGLDIERDARVTRITSSIVEGVADPGEKGVVLGVQLARRLGVDLGDEILCVTTRVHLGGTGYQVRRVNLTVRGTFKSGIYEVDLGVAYTSLEEAQRIFLLPPGSCQSLRLKVPRPRDISIESFGPVLVRALGPFHPVKFMTWKEFNPTFFSALELEKYAMFIILLLIVVVAAFNIIGTLVMMVSGKTREIGLLMAVGVSPRMVARVFVMLGLVLGTMGTALGSALGLGVCAVIRLHRFNLPESVYNIDRLPVIIQPTQILTIVGSSLLICLLASIVPARRAARMIPVEALRYE